MKTNHITNSFPRIFQLNQDFYLSNTMFFLESYRFNRVFCFKIDKSFYLFINYTLSGIAQDIVKLSPILFPINETITSRDYIVDSLLIDYGSKREPQFKRNPCNFGYIKFRTVCIQAFFDSATTNV